MREQDVRTAMLIGEDSVGYLHQKKVAVFGIGGVGGYVAEALARAGIGTLALIDNDTVSESNINRQIIALHSTVGEKKVDVMAKRITDIDPDICVQSFSELYLPSNRDFIDFFDYDYIVDCIDNVTAKIDVISRAKECNIPVISAMGTGNRLDATHFEISVLEKTSGCPLARVMRRELKKRGVSDVKVVYSKESVTPISGNDAHETNKQTPGSISFVPPVAGLYMANAVIEDLLNKHKSDK